MHRQLDTHTQEWNNNNKQTWKEYAKKTRKWILSSLPPWLPPPPLCCWCFILIFLEMFHEESHAQYTICHNQIEPVLPCPVLSNQLDFCMLVRVNCKHCNAITISKHMCMYNVHVWMCIGKSDKLRMRHEHWTIACQQQQKAGEWASQQMDVTHRLSISQRIVELSFKVCITCIVYMPLSYAVALILVFLQSYASAHTHAYACYNSIARLLDHNFFSICFPSVLVDFQMSMWIMVPSWSVSVCNLSIDA